MRPAILVACVLVLLGLGCWYYFTGARSPAPGNANEQQAAEALAALAQVAPGEVEQFVAASQAARAAAGGVPSLVEKVRGVEQQWLETVARRASVALEPTVTIAELRTKAEQLDAWLPDLLRAYALLPDRERSRDAVRGAMANRVNVARALAVRLTETGDHDAAVAAAVRIVEKYGPAAGPLGLERELTQFRDGYQLLADLARQSRPRP